MNERHQWQISALKFFDTALIAMSFCVTAILIVHIRHNVSVSHFFSLRAKVSNLIIFAIGLLTSHFFFGFCGLYRSRRLTSARMEMTDIVKAVTLSAICFVVISSPFSIHMMTALFLALFWAITTAALCVNRFALRLALARIRAQGRNLRYMLVLGTNSRAVDFARKLLASKERGYRLVGFVDDEWPGMQQFKQSEFNLVCHCDELNDFLRHHVVDEVVVYLPLGSFYKLSADVSSLCTQHGITIHFSSDLFGQMKVRYRPEEFAGGHFISTLSHWSLGGWPIAVKRMLDFVVSAALLLLSSPVLIASAIVIKLTSPGPVFFKQVRIGLNKRKFEIYKLRTMVQNAETLMPALEGQNEVSGPVFKIKKDPRITTVGKFLRRSSIDELPQLFNVLNGDMSLVGPRPLPVRDFEGFNEDWQRRRFSVKPGITCLWQVNGRSSLSFEQWMRLDLRYMDEWSLWLDLKILAKTVPAVFKGVGAA